MAEPILNDAARRALTSGHLIHLATINPDGTPHLSAVWAGLAGDEIVIGHMMGGRKIHNIARDPRVALTVEATGSNPIGMANYLAVTGTARLEEGGAPELLQRLAATYLGPGIRFPPMDDPPPGHVIAITPLSVSGTGPWKD